MTPGRSSFARRDHHAKAAARLVVHHDATRLPSPALSLALADYFRVPHVRYAAM
ncbi:hypothetical protein AB0G02_20900 [Actinosynnema sp. NPDC023658]|uniref:hypothetical protein n=1 Tax=Actinosynnema sp. NPDC023658 TaxID=3155465 RepID=UPI0033F26234